MAMNIHPETVIHPHRMWTQLHVQLAVVCTGPGLGLGAQILFRSGPDSNIATKRYTEYIGLSRAIVSFGNKKLTRSCAHLMPVT